MRKISTLMRVACASLALALAAQAAARQGEITIEGRLARTVEAGGWLIVSDAGKYLILNPRNYQSQTWFREGATVEATGEARQGVVTVFQEGVPFQVRTMRGKGRGASQPAGTDSGGEPTTGGGRQTGGTQTGGSQSGGAAAPGIGRGVTRVVVSGDAVVQSQPDTAILSIAVVTQNASASEAQAENASKTDAVIRAIKSAAGAGAEVKTGGYSLQPQYNYKDGQAPVITGYIARNSVSVTTGALDRVGAILDAASRAGANTIDGLSFTLRRDEGARSTALANATREAMRKARVIADALGGRVIRIVEVQEAGTVRPIPVYEGGTAGRLAMTTQTATPIEPGSLEVRAEVQLVAEIGAKD
jgi:uncharacterized protein YggE